VTGSMTRGFDGRGGRLGAIRWARGSLLTSSIPAKPVFTLITSSRMAPNECLDIALHTGNGAPYDSSGSLRPFAKNATEW
jgi:hypothetical protein